MSTKTFIPAPTLHSSAGSAQGISVDYSGSRVEIRTITDEDGSVVAYLTAEHVDALVRALSLRSDLPLRSSE
jgi:hypothetical protein